MRTEGMPPWMTERDEEGRPVEENTLLVPETDREKAIAWDFFTSCPDGFTVDQIKQEVSMMLTKARLKEPLR
jgi:hypothetical protein